MTVYVIEKGDYSARHVVAVKEKLEEAEEIVKFIKRYQGESEYIEITPYDTADFSFVAGGDAYIVGADTDGNIESIRKINDYDYEDYYDDWAAYDLDTTWRYKVENRIGYGGLDFYVVAKDDAHALKIASDKLAEWKYRTKVEGIE